MHIVKNRLAGLRVIRAVGVGLLAVSQAVAGNGQATGWGTANQIRVLFIGNSLTYVNDLPAELQALVAAAYPDGPSLQYQSVTPGGCTLQKHWKDGKAAAKITEGHWDYVVLQEQSQIPLCDREQVFKYARLFDREIKRVGAKTVFYMTFPLKKKFVDGDVLPDVYATLGKELGAIVVPVDVAWHEAATLDAQLALYQADGVHPAPAGTYLAVCCFGETLWGQPAGPYPAKLLRANHEDKPLVELDERQARELQKAAAVAVSSAAKAAAPAKPAARALATRISSDAPWVDLFNGKDNPIVIDEYGWLWINRDGTPTTLSRDVYAWLLPGCPTAEQYREAYARMVAAKTEFWRCGRKVAGVLHFCGLGYSRPGGQTSDNFIDLERPTLEPHFFRYVRDAFAPVGLMIDFWDRALPAGGRVETARRRDQ